MFVFTFAQIRSIYMSGGGITLYNLSSPMPSSSAMENSPRESHLLSSARKSAIRILSLLMIPGALMSAQVQAPLPITCHQNVVITRLVDEQGTFSDLLQAEGARPFRVNAFVVQNKDKRSIIGIVGIWKITDASGQVNTSTFASDIFLSTVQNSVLPPDQTLVLTPNGWINPAIYRQMRTGGTDWEHSGRAQLVSGRIMQASAVTASIDSVIFEDGEICGVNSAYLDKEIQARKRAALFVSSMVRTSMLNGADWKTPLKAASMSIETTPPYQEGFWKQKFASDLLGSRGDPTKLLDFFENLPSPPAFHPCATVD